MQNPNVESIQSPEMFGTKKKGFKGFKQISPLRLFKLLYMSQHV